MATLVKRIPLNHWFRGMHFTSVTIVRYSMHAPDIVCLLQLAVNAAHGL